MSSNELTQCALALPEEERIELARQLIESVQTDGHLAGRISEGVQRIEEIATGRVAGLDDEQFRAALR